MAHLDRPYKDWALTVGRVPADAMHLPHHGRIAPGLPANLVLFKARGYSELLARPQWDRVGSSLLSALAFPAALYGIACGLGNLCMYATTVHISLLLQNAFCMIGVTAALRLADHSSK